MVVTKGEGSWQEDEEGKGVKYTAKEGAQTLGGEYTMQCNDDVLQNCTLGASCINKCHPNTFNSMCNKDLPCAVYFHISISFKAAAQ